MTTDITKCTECGAHLEPKQVRFWYDTASPHADDFEPLCSICFDARVAKLENDYAQKDWALPHGDAQQ